MPDTNAQHDDDLELEEIEAYCVVCKQHVVMENATAVWTKRGAPGTRGECDICGTTVFRMGRTDAHRGMVQPDVSQFKEIAAGGPRKRGVTYATYISFTQSDLALARQISTDLSRTGIPTWLDDNPNAAEINWASGVHPALDDCTHMVVVLSEDALKNESVQKEWEFFREKRRPILIAQVDPVEAPNALRWSPRFDFAGDYKIAFRELVQALAS